MEPALDGVASILMMNIVANVMKAVISTTQTAAKIMKLFVVSYVNLDGYVTQGLQVIVVTRSKHSVRNLSQVFASVVITSYSSRDVELGCTHEDVLTIS